MHILKKMQILLLCEGCVLHAERELGSCATAGTGRREKLLIHPEFLFLSLFFIHDFVFSLKPCGSGFSLCRVPAW